MSRIFFNFEWKLNYSVNFGNMKQIVHYAIHCFDRQMYEDCRSHTVKLERWEFDYMEWGLGGRNKYFQIVLSVAWTFCEQISELRSLELLQQHNLYMSMDSKLVAHSSLLGIIRRQIKIFFLQMHIKKTGSLFNTMQLERFGWMARSTLFLLFRDCLIFSPNLRGTFD